MSLWLSGFHVWLALVLGIALIGVSGCAAHTTRLAHDQLDATKGFWLRSSTAQAFVVLEPEFRILDFRAIDQPSLLADHTIAQQGVRLAYMEGEQVPTSFSVGNVPAKVLERTDFSAKVRLEPASGLQYTVTLGLSDDQPTLELTTVLQNVGSAPRRVGCWTVLSFARDGNVIIPFGDKPRMRRRLVLSWWTAWPQPMMSFGRDALLADMNGQLLGDAAKVSVITEPGWVAFERNGQVLLLGAPYDASADYPEDGANVTFFVGNADAKQGAWCETELMGPEQLLQPGQRTQLSQTLRMLRVTAPPAPSADAWRSAIEQAINKTAP